MMFILFQFISYYVPCHCFVTTFIFPGEEVNEAKEVQPSEDIEAPAAPAPPVKVITAL